MAAALLVLVGLGLFVGGLLTGATVLYWACVAACVVAAGLLVGARRQTAAAADSAPPAEGPGAAATAAPAAPAQAAPAPEKPVEQVPVQEEAAPEAPSAPVPTGATAVGASATPEGEDDDPPVEEVEVTDLLIVVDLKDEVLVVDEHPRYHVAGCSWVGSRTTIPLPLDEARTDGFTPCGVCRPDATLADRVRARK